MTVERVELDDWSAWLRANKSHARGPAGKPILRDVATPEGTLHMMFWYDNSGQLRGVLAYAPNGVSGILEAGHFSFCVDPERRSQGIGSSMLRKAKRLWPNLNFEIQTYTPAGLACLQKMRRRKQ